LNRWLIIGLVALAAIPGCRRRDDSGPPLSMDIKVAPDPPVVGTASIELDVKDPGGAPVRGARITIEGTMTHPGMAPTFSEAEETRPGTYRARLPLTMAGDWVLLVEARLSSGETVRRQFDLPRVRSG
jgi:hypothetical protein